MALEIPKKPLRTYCVKTRYVKGNKKVELKPRPITPKTPSVVQIVSAIREYYKRNEIKHETIHIVDS